MRNRPHHNASRNPFFIPPPLAWTLQLVCNQASGEHIAVSCHIFSYSDQQFIKLYQTIFGLYVEVLLYLHRLLPGTLLCFVDSLIVGLFVSSCFIRASSPARLQLQGHSSPKTGTQLKKRHALHTHTFPQLYESWHFQHSAFLTWLIQLIMYWQRSFMRFWMYLQHF